MAGGGGGGRPGRGGGGGAPSPPPASPRPDVRVDPRRRWIPWQGADGHSPDGRRQGSAPRSGAGRTTPHPPPARPPARLPAPARRPASPETGDRPLASIDVADLARSFPTATGTPLVALDGVAFRVPERQVVAIVGPNGCGKSTLLRLVGGLLPPDPGPGG